MESIKNYKYSWTALIIIDCCFYYWKLYNPRHNFYISSKIGYKNLKICANGLESFCNANKITFSIPTRETYAQITNTNITKEDYTYVMMKSELNKIQVRIKNGIQLTQSQIQKELKKHKSDNFIL